MSWLTAITTPGHLEHAVVHYNTALDREIAASRVYVCNMLFNALNKIQTERFIKQTDKDLGEVKAFQTMILGLEAEARRFLLSSSELEALIDLRPRIMNHDILKHRGYRPGVEIDESLVKEASEVHRKLVSAHKELDGGGGNDIEDRTLRRLAELLYIVRSNIAHGEKTPSGPDHEKRERDEKVCSMVIPLQRVLFDLLLDTPSRKLITYGTLAFGQANHEVLANASGTWDNCVVRGSIRSSCGLPVLLWNPAGPEVLAQLFTSSQLPDLWTRIDEFEGAQYKRRLIPATTETHGIAIANVYLSSTAGAPSLD